MSMTTSAARSKHLQLCVCPNCNVRSCVCPNCNGRSCVCPSCNVWSCVCPNCNVWSCVSELPCKELCVSELQCLSELQCFWYLVRRCVCPKCIVRSCATGAQHGDTSIIVLRALPAPHYKRPQFSLFGALCYNQVNQVPKRLIIINHTIEDRNPRCLGCCTLIKLIKSPKRL